MKFIYAMGVGFSAFDSYRYWGHDWTAFFYAAFFGVVLLEWIFLGRKMIEPVN